MNRDDKTSVYLMKDSLTGMVKVGVSKNPVTRLKQLQTGAGTLEIIWQHQFSGRAEALIFEAALHTAFWTLNLRGEWFVLPDEIIEVVRLMTLAFSYGQKVSESKQARALSAEGRVSKVLKKSRYTSDRCDLDDPLPAVERRANNKVRFGNHGRRDRSYHALDV